MGKWDRLRDDDYDNFEKIKKIKKKKSWQKAADINDQFEKDEGEWSKSAEKDLFTARVVEVHKRYAFISPEPELLDIKTRDVRLATIAKKYLTTSRA